MHLCSLLLVQMQDLKTSLTGHRTAICERKDHLQGSWPQLQSTGASVRHSIWCTVSIVIMRNII